MDIDYEDIYLEKEVSPDSSVGEIDKIIDNIKTGLKIYFSKIEGSLILEIISKTITPHGDRINEMSLEGYLRETLEENAARWKKNESLLGSPITGNIMYNYLEEDSENGVPAKISVELEFKSKNEEDRSIYLGLYKNIEKALNK
jgi:hypothetical protein